VGIGLWCHPKPFFIIKNPNIMYMNRFFILSFFIILLFSSVSLACDICDVRNIDCPHFVNAGSVFSINFEYRDSGDAYPYNYVNLFLDDVQLDSKLFDSTDCSWKKQSFTTVAPSKLGTYTYMVGCYAAEDINDSYRGMYDNLRLCIVNVGFLIFPAPTCGDGSCDVGEKWTCPADCWGTWWRYVTRCGDGRCDMREIYTCPADCGRIGCNESTCTAWSNQGCGVGFCFSNQMYQTRNCNSKYCTTSRCLYDSSCTATNKCGNGVCDSGENTTCPSDCGIVTTCVESTCTAWSNKGCGAGTCTSTQLYQVRNCTTNCITSQCVADSSCINKCGNGVCDSGENVTCPADCGNVVACDESTCTAWKNSGCALGTCNSTSMYQIRNCTTNCTTSRCIYNASCGIICGNGICESKENVTCPSDCNGINCNSNGKCDSGETKCIDCGYCETDFDCANLTFNKCVNNNCTAVPACGDKICSQGEEVTCPADCGEVTACDESTCTAWSNKGCGAGTCTSTQMNQIRTCTNSYCTTSKCVSDSSCTATTSSCVKVSYNGAGRLDIVYVGDDYTSLSSFASDVTTFKNKLLSYEPFKSNTNKINIYRVDKIVDLGCEYNCNGIARLICCDISKVKTLASECPADQIVVLVNNNNYGGAGYISSDVAVSYRGDARVAVHEFGHSFGDLTDEYDDDPNCETHHCMMCSLSYGFASSPCNCLQTLTKKLSAYSGSTSDSGTSGSKTKTCSEAGGTCKTNSCTSYSSCSSVSGTCTSGYCCTGSCTTISTSGTCTGTCTCSKASESNCNCGNVCCEWKYGGCINMEYATSTCGRTCTCSRATTQACCEAHGCTWK
jgi:hypothetical protein